METLEFIIYSDGRVEERVSGIIGASCAEVTAMIEAKLGLVAYRELTSENFAQKQVTSQSDLQRDRVSDTENSNFSHW